MGARAISKQRHYYDEDEGEENEDAYAWNEEEDGQWSNRMYDSRGLQWVQVWVEKRMVLSHVPGHLEEEAEEDEDEEGSDGEESDHEQERAEEREGSEESEETAEEEKHGESEEKEEEKKNEAKIDGDQTRPQDEEETERGESH